MTTDQIDRLINRRNKLTNRRDGRLNRPALDEIDAKLREVPDGQDNRVDKLLGRPCAVLPTRAEYTVTQAEQFRLECEGQPDGIVDHSDALSGAWA